MAIPIARIRSFVEKMEQSLAPAPDRTRWIRLMADVAHGETDESAIAAHIAAHPEDAERINWVSWIIYTGVSRAQGSVILGDRPPAADPIAERSPDYQSVAAEAAPEKPAAPPATVPNGTVEKPAASPAPEPKKPGPENENEIVAGFNRRLYYPPTGFYP
jgi:hypothetical protein